VDYPSTPVDPLLARVCDLNQPTLLTIQLRG
jgi:hypothetical protein